MESTLCLFLHIDLLSAQERGLLVKHALWLLEENCVIVQLLTFDGDAVNLATMKKLGACLDVLSPAFKPYFLHPVPVSNDKVYIFMDPSHMLKNVWNLFGKMIRWNKNKSDLLYTASMYDAEGKKILWMDIEDIVDLQRSEGLRAANKSTPRHVKYEERITNVCLVAQTLSHSTASVLRYIQITEPTKFCDVDGTANFAEHFNKCVWYTKLQNADWLQAVS